MPPLGLPPSVRLHRYHGGHAFGGLGHPRPCRKCPLLPTCVQPSGGSCRCVVLTAVLQELLSGPRCASGGTCAPCDLTDMGVFAFLFQSGSRYSGRMMSPNAVLSGPGVLVALGSAQHAGRGPRRLLLPTRHHCWLHLRSASWCSLHALDRSLRGAVFAVRGLELF